MKKSIMLLVIITLISKAFGFTRDITLSYFYGAGSISDAYIISLTIPSVIFGFIGVGISTGYIPMYSRIEKDFGVEASNRFTSNLINILLIISSIIILLSMIFTADLVKVFAAGFSGEVLSLAVVFTRISLLGLYFTLMIFIFKGYLQIKGNYSVPALIGFPLNIITITAIVISYHTNVLVLSIGGVIAIIGQLVLLIYFVNKTGYKHRLILEISDKHIKRMAIISLPTIIGISVNQVNVLVDRTLASQIVEGGISALNYANRLNLFIQAIFVLSISTVMYPIISKMVADDNISGLKKSLSESIISISVLVMPATIGAMIFPRPIVEFLFGRGAFDVKAIVMTSQALFFYSIGMIGFGLREIVSRVFYSFQDTTTPMINASIGVTINIILNLVLSKFMGLEGLALATSIAALLTSLLMLGSIRKKIGPFDFKKIAISFLKILTASAIMGAISYISFSLLGLIINQNLSLLIAIGLGVFLYMIIIFFMKIEEVDHFIKSLMKKIRTQS